METHRTTCPLDCPDSCSLAVTVERGRILKIEPGMAGAGNLRLMFVTILPNCLAPLIVQATLGMAGAIIAEARKTKDTAERMANGEGPPGEFPFVNGAYPQMYLDGGGNNGAKPAEEPTRLFAGLTVEDLGDGRSRFTEAVEGEASGFFKIASSVLQPLVKRSIAKDFRVLKGLLERA